MKGKRDLFRKTGLFPESMLGGGGGGGSGDPASDMLRRELLRSDSYANGKQEKKTRAPIIKHGENSSSLDVVAAMAKRLRQLEAAQKEMRSRLVSAEKENMSLRKSNDLLAKELEEVQVSGGVSGRALMEENGALRRQIFEMEAFLADYGMVWVGGKKDDASSDGDTSIAEESKKRFRVNPRILLRKLAELNALAGEHEAQIESDGRGVHRFGFKSKVRLAVYEDGILLKRGPFRPYDHPAGEKFVRDVLDGYFPSEFKESYPDGIVFDLVDKSCETHGERFEAFSGQGDKLMSGGSTRLADMGGRAFHIPHQDIGDKREAFLASLPETVVRSGQVVSVREGVAGLLLRGRHELSSKAPGSVVLVPTPALDDIADGAQVTTLRVKRIGGAQTLVLKHRFDDTVADVRKCIDEHLADDLSAPYDLRTAFPNKSYDDWSVTLRDAGLVPNAAMMMTRASKK